MQPATAPESRTRPTSGAPTRASTTSCLCSAVRLRGDLRERPFTRFRGAYALAWADHCGYWNIDTKGTIMPVWAWIVLVGGVIGMLGAALIVAAVFEITSMPFRKWDVLP